jgi:hypothetical protein
MHKSLLLVLLCFALHAAEPAMSVSVSSLHIDASVPAKRDGGKDFTFSSGTALKLLLSNAAGELVSFDAKGSVLASCKDDKGTDLLPRTQPSTADGAFGPFFRLSDDRKLLEFDLRAPRVPVKGSSSMTVTGTLAVRCAKNKKDFTQEGVKLVDGTAVSLGSMSVVVTRVGETKFTDGQHGFSLRTSGDFEQLAGLVFKKADGTVIKYKCPNIWKSGAFTTRDYIFPEKIEGVTIIASLWTDMTTQMVPFDVKITVGL